MQGGRRACSAHPCSGTFGGSSWCRRSQLGQVGHHLPRHLHWRTFSPLGAPGLCPRYCFQPKDASRSRQISPILGQGGEYSMGETSHRERKKGGKEG
jgi:hypothetical protein